MSDTMKPNMMFLKDYHAKRFTYTSNYTEDFICKNISFEAWGIFHKLLSLPPDWHFNQEIFAKMYNITPSKLRKNLTLLKRYGFFKSEPKQLPNGKLDGWIYTLIEEPDCVKLFKNSTNNSRHYPNADNISIADFPDDINKKNVV